MIARIWHGFTMGENTEKYETLLNQEILPGIKGKNIKGYKGAQVLRRELENETEFTTLLWFEDMRAIKDFVGEDHESVYVPEKARQLLSRFDQLALHHELRLGPNPNFAD